MNKTVLVTGGTQGIGKAIAIKFAKQGYNVAINCSSQKSFDEKGEDVVKTLEEYNIKAKCYVCDVADFNSCEDMVKKIKDDFETIDVLVNNAGITDDGLLIRMKEEQFTRVIDVNLKGVFNVTRQVAPLMFKKKMGKIINITSLTGVHGNAGQFNYAAAKAGIIGMTKTAAKELGARGITVNAVAPGFIQTAMTECLPDKIKDMVKNEVPLKRFGQPEDIANITAFLASDEASYITGQTIEVNGGLIL